MPLLLLLGASFAVLRHQYTPRAAIFLMTVVSLCNKQAFSVLPLCSSIQHRSLSLPLSLSPVPPSPDASLPFSVDERGVRGADRGVAGRDGSSPSPRAARALAVPGVRGRQDRAVHPSGDLLPPTGGCWGSPSPRPSHVFRTTSMLSDPAPYREQALELTHGVAG